MLRCWGCNHEFTSRLIERDSLIRGRDVAHGGPYRLYRCPSCQRESKVEATSKGQLFASPEKQITPMEFLFSWAEPLAPEDFLKIVQWHELHGDRRRAFFARDGDRRYARPTSAVSSSACSAAGAGAQTTRLVPSARKRRTRHPRLHPRNTPPLRSPTRTGFSA